MKTIGIFTFEQTFAVRAVESSDLSNTKDFLHIDLPSTNFTKLY